MGMPKAPLLSNSSPIMNQNINILYIVCTEFNMFLSDSLLYFIILNIEIITVININ